MKLQKFRSSPWFLPAGENVICAPNGDVDDFLDNVTAAMCVKTLSFHHRHY